MENKGSKKVKQFRFNIDSVYTIIDGKKFKSIGTFPKNEELISDMKRVYWKHGFLVEVKPDIINKEKIKLYWRKRKHGKYSDISNL